MKVTEHIQNANGKPLFSFEILPPLKGQNIQSIFDSIDPLMEFNPPFIDVTYHREEYEFKELENGLLQKKVVKKRPGTVGICAGIQNKYEVDAIPHILCGGFTKEDTENLLIDLDFLGIDNVVALRGDAVKSEIYFKPEKEGSMKGILLGPNEKLEIENFSSEDRPISLQDATERFGNKCLLIFYIKPVDITWWVKLVILSLIFIIFSFLIIKIWKGILEIYNFILHGKVD